MNEQLGYHSKDDTPFIALLVKFRLGSTKLLFKAFIIINVYEFMTYDMAT